MGIFPLFEDMKHMVFFFSLLVIIGINVVQVEAQAIERKKLHWEEKKIDLGTILEENGSVIAEFYGRNLHDQPVQITDVITDCGCTTVEYTKDTLSHYMLASVQVKYDPSNRGGYFNKLVIIRTTEDIYGDTLYLEGVNLPVPEEVGTTYPYKIGSIGFRLPAVNMGNIFTNEPKVKDVEVYNFGEKSFKLNEEQSQLPEYLKVELFPDVLAPQERGLLKLTYNGKEKNDLGFFEEQVKLDLHDDEEESLEFRLLAVVYEYFPPLPKSMEDKVAKLGISESEVNLSSVNSNSKVSKTLTLRNLGAEPLDIRKVTTNCNCLEVKLDRKSLLPKESTELVFTFDPKGRRGLDHKHITIFSSDPLNPVRTIVIKSSIR